MLQTYLQQHTWTATLPSLSLPQHTPKSFKLHRNVLAGKTLCSLVHRYIASFILFTLQIVALCFMISWLTKNNTPTTWLYITQTWQLQSSNLSLCTCTLEECVSILEEVCYGLYAAQRFALDDVKTECSERLKIFLSTDYKNALKVFNLHDRLSACTEDTQTYRVCEDIISKHFTAVLACDELVDIGVDCMERLLSMKPQEEVAEIDVFRALLKWMRATCVKKGLETSAEQLKAVGGDLIYLIRYTFISMDLLSAEVTPSGVLSNDCITALFQKVCGRDVDVPFCTGPRYVVEELEATTAATSVNNDTFVLCTLWSECHVECVNRVWRIGWMVNCDKSPLWWSFSWNSIVVLFKTEYLNSTFWISKRTSFLCDGFLCEVFLREVFLFQDRMRISDLYLARSITCRDYFFKERFYLDTAVHRCTFIASFSSLFHKWTSWLVVHSWIRCTLSWWCCTGLKKAHDWH